MMLDEIKMLEVKKHTWCCKVEQKRKKSQPTTIEKQVKKDFQAFHETMTLEIEHKWIQQNTKKLDEKFGCPNLNMPPYCRLKVKRIYNTTNAQTSPSEHSPY